MNSDRTTDGRRPAGNAQAYERIAAKMIDRKRTQAAELAMAEQLYDWTAHATDGTLYERLEAHGWTWNGLSWVDAHADDIFRIRITVPEADFKTADESARKTFGEIGDLQAAGPALIETHPVHGERLVCTYTYKRRGSPEFEAVTNH